MRFKDIKQENEVDDKINAVLQEEAATGALTSNYTPAHVHNNSDSPSIPFLNLTNKQFIISQVLPGTSAATSGNYGVFFIAPFQCSVIGAVCAFSTAGTSPLLQIERLTTKLSSGQGQSILSTPFSLSTTPNVSYGGSLVQSALTTLAIGDRLGLVISGTLTSLTQVVVQVLLSY